MDLLNFIGTKKTINKKKVAAGFSLTQKGSTLNIDPNQKTVTSSRLVRQIPATELHTLQNSIVEKSEDHKVVDFALVPSQQDMDIFSENQM